MRPRGTDAIPLPARPNIEQYRNRAKGLVKACASRDSDAVRAWAQQWLEALGNQANSISSGKRAEDPPTRFTEREIANEVDQIERDARNSHLIGEGDSVACTLTDAQLFLARLHDFVSWPKFAAHVDALSHVDSPNSEFEHAADAVVTGDLAMLGSMIRRNPQLVDARSAREHGATLLHYTAANGHEGYRQKSPPNAVDIARLLLDAGAKADALAYMYGVDVTTMEMLVSSVHPHNAGVQVGLIDTLVDFGANPNGPSDNGSPLMTAFRFHYPKAADALVRHGARIDNVMAAAALGRSDLLEAWVVDGVTIADGVRLPAGPWPRLKPEPRVHLEQALAWAATWARTDAVALLLARGVNPNAADGDMPALHHAAARGLMEIVRLLLSHGASIEIRNSYDGTTLSSTLWFAYNSPFPGVDYAAVIRELIELGAHTDVEPDMQRWIDGVPKRG
jgi:ankyrin repeat protein